MIRACLMALSLALFAGTAAADDEVTEKTGTEKRDVQAAQPGAARQIERFDVVRAEGPN